MPRLTLPERVALVYTSLGSQRAVARELGISHQKVGRLLKTAQPTAEGGYSKNSRVLNDPDLRDSVRRAFARHKKRTEQRAALDGVPYVPAVPIYAARMERKDGTVSDRVIAKNLHWVTDALRGEWLKANQQSGRYVSVSIESIVNLLAYGRRAAARVVKQGFETESSVLGRESIDNRIERGEVSGPMFTPYRTMRPGLSPAKFLLGVEQLLQERHAATATVYATTVLMQLNPIQDRTTAKAIRKREREAIKGKATGNKRRRKG